jgi:hypothetical protein
MIRSVLASALGTVLGSALLLHWMERRLLAPKPKPWGR